MDRVTAGGSICNITETWTNGTGKYALTKQEDNGSLEAMIRADHAGLMDFSRAILMRVASDFDRAWQNRNLDCSV